MSTSQFHFQSAKRSETDRKGLPSAVNATLKQFQLVAAANMKHGEGSVVVSVTEPSDGVYFVVVMAGPFPSLDLLRQALTKALDEETIKHLRRLGID